MHLETKLLVTSLFIFHTCGEAFSNLLLMSELLLSPKKILLLSKLLLVLLLPHGLVIPLPFTLMVLLKKLLKVVSIL